MKHLFYTFLSGLLFISNILPSNAQDYPPNPLEKEGYRLIFHDEFDGKEINTDKWFRSICRHGLKTDPFVPRLMK